MPDYIITPYGNGKGWLCCTGSSLKTGALSMIMRGKFGVTINYAKHSYKGIQVPPKKRGLILFDSPFEILEALSKALVTKAMKVSDNTYKIGTTTVGITSEETRGITWKFVQQQ